MCGCLADSVRERGEEIVLCRFAALMALVLAVAACAEGEVSVGTTAPPISAATTTTTAAVPATGSPETELYAATALFLVEERARGDTVWFYETEPMTPVTVETVPVSNRPTVPTVISERTVPSTLPG